MSKNNVYNLKSEKLIFIKPGKVEKIPVKLPKRIQKNNCGRLVSSDRKLPLMIISNTIGETKEDTIVDITVQNPSKSDIFIGKGDVFCTMTITNNVI